MDIFFLDGQMKKKKLDTDRCQALYPQLHLVFDYQHSHTMVQHFSMSALTGCTHATCLEVHICHLEPKRLQSLN